MGGAHGNQVGWRQIRPKIGLSHIAHIAIAPRDAKGPSVSALQHVKPVAPQHLSIPRTVGCGAQIGNRDADGGGLCKHFALALAGISRKRHSGIGRSQAAIRHSDKSSGKAAKSARAPWPTPPLGRAGAAVGFHP